MWVVVVVVNVFFFDKFNYLSLGFQPSGAQEKLSLAFPSGSEHIRDIEK